MKLLTRAEGFIMIAILRLQKEAYLYRFRTSWSKKGFKLRDSLVLV